MNAFASNVLHIQRLKFLMFLEALELNSSIALELNSSTASRFLNVSKSPHEAKKGLYLYESWRGMITRDWLVFEGMHGII